MKTSRVQRETDIAKVASCGNIWCSVLLMTKTLVKVGMHCHIPVNLILVLSWDSALKFRHLGMKAAMGVQGFLRARSTREVLACIIAKAVGYLARIFRSQYEHLGRRTSAAGLT